jgi:hypothetical protein
MPFSVSAPLLIIKRIKHSVSAFPRIRRLNIASVAVLFDKYYLILA